MSQSETKPSPVAALAVEEVTKSYGATQALGGISFAVRAGEVFGLLGPNGAGKTSLISIVVTLEKPTRGKVRVFGHDVEAETRAAKSVTGWVGQEIINHGFFEVEEIMGFHAGYYGVRRPKERIEYLLHRLDLWNHRKKKVKQLSGGMKRRLMIAKALVHEPGLLLLDEPTAGVDVELRERLWEFVRELRRDGISILLTTHYLEEAEQLCDRVAIIHHGLIREVGPTTGLIEKWSQRRVTFSLRGSVAGLRHPELIEHTGQTAVYLTSMRKTVSDLLQESAIAPADLLDVKIEEGKLEDVFRRLTQEPSA